MITIFRMSKPPNIIVFCNGKKFETICNLINNTIGRSRYTIYPLNEKEPWEKYCCLVVLATHPTDVPFLITRQVKQYYQNGGKVLSLGGHFTTLMPLTSCETPPGPCLDELCSSPMDFGCGQGQPGSLIVLPMYRNQAVTELKTKLLQKVLGDLGVVICDKGDITLSPLHVYSRSSSTLENFFTLIRKQTVNNIVKSGQNMFSIGEMSNAADCVPLIRGSDDSEFYSALRTKQFPAVLLYGKVVSSTQDILWESSVISNSTDSVAVIGDVQVSGKGRAKNKWLSPVGTLCLSFCINLSLNSFIGQKISFVQYLTTLAAVKAIKFLAQKDLPIGIKWPNDLYTKKGEKIGGVLVNCSSSGDTVKLCIGIGINVNNDHPTVCLSSLLDNKLSTLTLAAEICNAFEEELELFNTEGHEQFVRRYCEAWLHSGSTVRVQLGSVDCLTDIESIDDNGYLSVRKRDGTLLSVQPDGNSFDMLNNLIAVKFNA